MTTSGRARTTMSRSAVASYTSTTTAVMPRALSSAAVSPERVVPVTSWPASSNSGMSRRPIAPAAPARNTFMPNSRIEVRGGAAVSRATRRIRNMGRSAASGHRHRDLGGVEVFVELDRLAVGEPPGVAFRRRHHLAARLGAPAAEAQHHDAVALRDEMVDAVFDHVPIARQAAEIGTELVATAVVGHVVDARHRLGDRAEANVGVTDREPMIHARAAALRPAAIAFPENSNVARFVRHVPPFVPLPCRRSAVRWIIPRQARTILL